MSSQSVIAAFNHIARSRRVFQRRELTRLLRSQLDSSGFSGEPGAEEMIQILREHRVIDEVTLKSEASYAPITRFATRAASPFEIAISLKTNSYLCHSTAVYLHGLTDHIPQTIYVNAEQSIKPKPTGELSQGSIDRAFRARQRTSRYVFIHERNRIVILSGKHTGRHGVTQMTVTTGESLPVTDLERTLVDITVRPVYGGGVHAVLAAFRTARDRMSTGKLIETLRVLDYAYPYHQALGFYLERAGAPPKALEPLRRIPAEFDFYLAHGLKTPEYSPSWRIFYPKGL